MGDPFDPYYTWLGISKADQPPNHYRPLAIDLFEPIATCEGLQSPMEFPAEVTTLTPRWH